MLRSSAKSKSLMNLLMCAWQLEGIAVRAMCPVLQQFDHVHEPSREMVQERNHVGVFGSFKIRTQEMYESELSGLSELAAKKMDELREHIWTRRYKFSPPLHLSSLFFHHPMKYSF
jgi:hypothetical protein